MHATYTQVQPTRSGQAPPLKLLAIASVAVMVLLAALLWNTTRAQAPSGKRLTFYCAAGIKPPMEAIAHEYGQRYDVQVELQYGGSGTLLSQLEVAGRGDLYLAGDDSFLHKARDKGLARELFTLATMRPVLGVPAGNPKGVTSIADLLRPDLRVGLAVPDAAAVGKIARKVLQQASLWEECSAQLAVQKPTVSELANDLVLGAIDVAIIWDATAAQYETIDAIHDERLDAYPRNITLGVLSSSTVPSRALHFARYASSVDQGLPHFNNYGYAAVAGDPWVEQPELLLMSGAMLNGAIDATVAAFEEREGVRVTRIYNGCGLLVAQMKSGQQPDAYFACDASFMQQVQDDFNAAQEISSNRMVILTAKYNEHQIQGLADLCQPGLRIGLAHPEKSALGLLTRKLLAAEGLSQRFAAAGNLEVESATGDLLVNQISTGSLDAVVVYASNAAEVRDALHLIHLEQEQAIAIQPFAISKQCAQPALTARLQEALQASGSRARFEQLGFEWSMTEQETR